MNDSEHRPGANALATAHQLIRVVRLCASDRKLAQQLFELMAEVFEEKRTPLSDAYLDRLLGRADFWAMAAFSRSPDSTSEELVGGLSAHALAMTHSESSELFLYDIAVRGGYQRRGVGRLLVTGLREQALAQGIDTMFVPADDEDLHALDFYRALGGAASPVTFFTFAQP
jgi:aminoglycoside 3-N-acetyltransferase I